MTKVKIPEFGVTIELPAWYKEAQEELARPGPAWPPQVTIDVADIEKELETALPGRFPLQSKLFGWLSHAKSPPISLLSLGF